jgi:hypothetical protein
MRKKVIYSALFLAVVAAFAFPAFGYDPDFHALFKKNGDTVEVRNGRALSIGGLNALTTVPAAHDFANATARDAYFDGTPDAAVGDICHLQDTGFIQECTVAGSPGTWVNVTALTKGPQGDAGTNGADGSDGTDGTNGEDGVDAYVYVAYASDDSGTDFNLTPSDSLKYRSEIHSDTEIASPDSDDFSGATWVKYLGDDGEDGDGSGDFSSTALESVDVSDVTRAFKYKNAAGEVVRVELFFDSAVTDYADKDTVGSINWAINQLEPWTSTKKGGEIFLNAGTYEISSPIYIRPELSIKGVGSYHCKIILADDSNCDVLQMPSPHIVKFDGSSQWLDLSTELRSQQDNDSPDHFSVVHYSGSAYSDITHETYRDEGSDAINFAENVCADDNDAIFIGSDWRFSTLSVDVAEAAAGTGVIRIYYFDGTDFSNTATLIDDGSASGGDTFAQDGTIVFDVPADWSIGASDVDSSLDYRKYYIKIMAESSATVTTDPDIDKIIPLETFDDVLEDDDDILYVGLPYPIGYYQFVGDDGGDFAAGAGALITKYFDGSDFDTSVPSVTDGTLSGGNTLAQDSVITFADAPADWAVGANSVSVNLDADKYYIAFSLTNTPSTTPDIAKLSIQDAQFFHLADIYIDGNKSGNPNGGDLLRSTKTLWDGHVSNSTFMYAGDDAIDLEEMWGWVLNGLVVEFSADNGIYLEGTNVKVTNCKINENVGDQVVINGGSGIFTANETQTTTANTVNFNVGYAGSNTMILGNTIKGNGHGVVYDRYANSIQISNNYFANSGMGINILPSDTVSQSGEGVIMGNYFDTQVAEPLCGGVFGPIVDRNFGLIWENSENGDTIPDGSGTGGVTLTHHLTLTSGERIGFNSGSEKPSMGDTIVENGGDATAKIAAVFRSSGSWAAGDAAGYFFLYDRTNTIGNASQLDISGGSSDIATASGQNTYAAREIVIQITPKNSEFMDPDADGTPNAWYVTCAGTNYTSCTLYTSEDMDGEAGQFYWTARFDNSVDR